MSASDPGTDFISRGFQGYTRAEMTATTAITSREDPRWRWVLPVTRTTRNYLIAQIPALQLSFAMAVALIYAAAHIENAIRILDERPEWETKAQDELKTSIEQLQLTLALCRSALEAYALKPVMQEAAE